MSHARRGSTCRLWSLLLLLSSAFVSLAPMHAQEYRGVIYGHITDSSGAVVPKAKIEVKGPQQTYKTTSRGNGEFTVPFIEPGHYVVTATAPGFNTVTKTDVVIDVSAKLTVDFRLQPGATDTVTVAADAAVELNTSDASGGTVMDPEKVQALPLNGRQIYQLLNLTPGVKNGVTQYGPTGNSGTRGWDETNNTSINGQSGNYNQFSLNGAPVSQQGGGGAGTWNIAPNVDAVEEFKVMTNTYDAQYGRTGGGSVNTILKTGTNQYHGTAFDFWRNSILDANYYQLNQTGTAKPRHNEHQFGGTVGGPIWRDKIFFFGSFEGYRQVLPVNRIVTVPTADMLPGNGDVNLSSYLTAMGMGNIYDPTTLQCTSTTANGCSTYARSQFVNNVIPASRISPIAAKILAVFPKANLPGYNNNYVAEDPGKYQYNQPIVRIDHNFSDKTRLYGMFAWWSGTEYRNTSGLPGAAAQGNINDYRSTLTQVLDLTHTFTPKLVADVRLSFNRMYNVSNDGSVAAGSSTLTAADLGLNMPAIPTTTRSLAPEIGLDDCCLANVIGNTSTPNMYETYDLAPSITQTFGKHNLHYGGEFMLFHDVPTGVGQPNGNFWFGPGYTERNPRQQANNDGSAMADLLLGIPESGGVDYFQSVYESYKSIAGYIQDDWKIIPKLTLNLGLRYEQETSPEDRNHRLNAGFCYTCTNPVSSLLTATPALPNGSTFSGPITGGPQFSSSSLSPYANYIGTFLPKVGFSWLIAPNLVMRGGYGMSTALGIELGAQSTWQQTTSYTTTLDGGLTPSGYFASGTPYPNGVIAPAGASQGLLSGIGNSLQFDRRERKIPRVQQYSFGFQGETGQHMIYDIEYVGSHATRLRSGMYLNSLSPADFAKGHADNAYLDQLVVNPFYGAISSATTIGSSSKIQAKRLMVPYPQYDYVYDYANPQGYNVYNSLIAKLERRFSNGNVLIKGLSFLTSFTWSKTMSATSRLNNSSDGLVDAQPYYALSTGDRPWDFAFSGLYGLPFGRGGLVGANVNRFVDQFIGNWQISWIFNNDGGLPVSWNNQSGFLNHTTYNCGNYNIVPSGHHSYQSWLNNSNQVAGNAGSCFTNFPEYTKVTQQPITAAVRQPWAQQTQFGIQKRFDLTEQVKFQFKAEAFNLTNTPIFPGPTTSGVTGQVTRVSYVPDPNAPGAWTGYGTVGSTQLNFPRQIQLSGKILF